MSSLHRVESGTATLIAETSGEGNPVVFLHAAVTDRRMWRAEMDAVSTNNRAIAYDRRGFGETSAEVEDFSSVADLMAVLDATSNGAPAILIGCSQGGRIAIDAGFMYPERVRALVLIAPNVTGAPKPVYSPKIEALVAQQKEAETAGDLERLSEIKARLWLDGPLAPEGRVSGQARELFHKMHSIVLQSPPVGTDTDIVPNIDHLGEISAPSLIVWGNLDFPHIQIRCQHLVDVMPNSSGQEMSDAAHLPSLEQPGEVARRLVEFIGHLPT